MLRPVVRLDTNLLVMKSEAGATGPGVLGSHVRNIAWEKSFAERLLLKLDRLEKNVLKYSMSQNWSERRGDNATGLTGRQSETRTRRKKAIGGCGAYLYLEDIVLACTDEGVYC